jgi:serine/threonine protein kinase/class 3 adenylate cyclase
LALPFHSDTLVPHGEKDMNATTIRMDTNESVERTNDSLTILFAEVRQPSEAEGQAADPAARERADDLRCEQTAAIDRYNGRIIKMLGNSIVAEFSDMASAVRAAVENQRLAHEKNGQLLPEERASLRIGIHAVSGGQGIDLFGGAVNLAAEITMHAAAEQILISKPVSDAISQESDLPSAWLGSMTMDGRTEEQDIFQVQWAEAPAGIPPRYEVLSQIGAGGMGVVYKVRDLEAGEIVALKILKAGIAADPAMQENLRREVCLSRKVTHKNVCRIHEFNRSQGAAYLSMEFVDGESLLARLQRTGAIPWAEAIVITQQICTGLREAHAQGIVHRDLKPANIMLGRGNGAVKIMDFGIARSFQNTANMTSTMIGTPAYMAPEQVELKRTDARTDIYSLGLVLYEMVTGTAAFGGDTPIAVALKQLKESPKRPREIAAGLPAHAENAILRCLQKDPAKRFASVDELMAALDRRPKVRPAASTWAVFVTDMRTSYVDVSAAAGRWMAKAQGFVRQIDWKGLAANRKAKSIAMGAGVAVALVGISALVVHGSHKTRTVNSVSPATGTAPSSGAPPMTEESATPGYKTQAQIATANSADSAQPISSYSISLTSNSSPTEPALVLPDTASAATKPVQGKPPAKPKAGAKISAPAAASRVPAAQTPSADATEPAAGNLSIASESGATPAEIKPQDSTPQELAALATANAEPVNAAPIGAASDPGGSTALADGAPRYFDVGTFKDSMWADQAVQKLTELGFHAQSVHKTVLWVHSYQVRVGPYSDTKSMTEAGMRLTEQGFKPHVVK